jgi:hypothetical protein
MSLIERLKNPEDHYELTDPKKANAVLMSLCQEAAEALAAPVQEPVKENTMIYKTFEQWKSGNVLEHGVPRTEYYSEDQLDLVEMGWNYGYDAGRAVEQALDKKAENAREIGLDYEPVQEPVKWSDHEPDGRRYPAVPDAFGTREGEHPQYVQGWNDCRAEMLKGMKP